MKYFQVVFALGFLLAATNSFAAPAPDLIVSGSNDPLVNGTYAYNSDFNGKASWAKGDYVLRWSPALMGDAWNIENPSAAAGSGEMYYWNWYDTAVPKETSWDCSHDYVNPCTPPVVTENPLPDSLIVSGTFDTFLNGLYTRENLNANGYPQYTMDVYKISATGGMVAWIIEDASKQYYIHYDSSQASVPEAGWSLSTHAGSPTSPSPPVVTSYQVPDTLIVSGTVDSFLNGNWTRENLNSDTGYPRYTMGDYEMHVEGVWIAPWIIDHASTGNQYYTNTLVNGALVPEYGWDKLFHAGSPTSPPVVTEQELPDRYHVRWAGSSEVNGVYSRVLNSLDGLVYEKEAIYHLEAGYYALMAYGYGITKSGTGTFYSVEDESLLIPSSGWSLGAHGIANPPYVFPYTFPWQMYLPSVTGGQK